MGAFKNLKGKRFGPLTVIDISHRSNGVIFWNCICNCGEKIKLAGHIVREKLNSTKDCGCKKRSNNTLQSYLNKVIIGEKCWGWSASKSHGYGIFGIIGKKQNILAHRFSYSLFKGEIPKGYFVLHKCDNPECSRPSHLFLGTQEDNMKDMKRKNRSRSHGLRHEDHPRAKLDWDKVEKIRRSKKERSVLAKEYGVDYTVIYNIQKNKTWIEKQDKTRG